MANINIDVVNASTVLRDVQVQAMVAACQKQINHDFAPAWGVAASLHAVSSRQKPHPGHWWMAILDTSDVAGALGYHDVTDTGLPLGKVFAKTTIDAGFHVSVTLSHELLEQIIDSEVNLTVQGPSPSDSNVPVFYAYETCDAVEDDSLGYQIDGIQVSGFVLPAYFETFNTTGPWDHGHHLTGGVPTLTPGGYMAYYDISTGQWTQVFQQKHGTSHEAYLARPREGSRRARRQIPPHRRLRSTVLG